MERKAAQLGKTALKPSARERISMEIAQRWGSARAGLKPLGQHGYIWLVTVGLLVAAQATLIWAPKVGIYINAAALAGLTAVAVLRQDARKVAVSMAIIPVANMVTASIMPHGVLGQAVVLYITLLLLAILYRFVFTLEHPLANTKLSAKGYALTLPLMLIAGQTVGAIGYLFLRNHYPYHAYSLPLVALISVVFAFAEEMILRGLIQQQGSQLFHPVAAAFATTVLYAFLAIDHGTMLTLPVAVLLGAVLSFTYYKKQNLILTTTINAAAKLTYIALVASFILR
jgi:membrane protease YdiL (CAAX protease family)